MSRECEREANWRYAKRYYIADKNGHSPQRCHELAEEVRDQYLKECQDQETKPMIKKTIIALVMAVGLVIASSNFISGEDCYQRCARLYAGNPAAIAACQARCR